MLGVTWVTGIVVTAAISDEDDRGEAIGYMAIPVAGPWVMIGSDLDTDDYTGALVGAGVLQSAGLAMTIIGLTVRREKQVPITGFTYGKRGESAMVMPAFAGPAGAGAVAVGTF